MPTVFPGGLDNFTNPTPADRLSTPTVLHSTQHTNANDAIEALEAKVGINGSLDADSLDYKISAITPTGTVVSSNTTLGASHHVVVVTNGSTITLPSATGISDREYNIIRTGTSNVVINTTNLQTISGDTVLVLTNRWDSVVVKAIQIDGVDQWVRCS